MSLTLLEINVNALRLMLFLSIIHSVNAQINIELYRVDLGTVTFEIETHILNRIEKIYFLKTGNKLTFNVKTVKMFREILPALNKSKELSSMAIGSISITKMRKEIFSFSIPYIFIDQCIAGISVNEN